MCVVAMQDGLQLAIVDVLVAPVVQSSILGLAAMGYEEQQKCEPGRSR